MHVLRQTDTHILTKIVRETSFIIKLNVKCNYEVSVYYSTLLHIL